MRGYGRVEPAGPCSILAASRNGPPKRAPPLPVSKFPMAKCHLRVNGDVRDATYPKMSYLHRLHVGARKRWIPSQLQVSLHSHVVRHVPGLGFSLRNVRIHARQPAMPALVHHVLRWAPRNSASVERDQSPGDALTPITRMAGVAAKSAAN